MPRNYGNAFLPAVYQGTPLGKAGSPAAQATIRNLTNPVLSPEAQRSQFDLLRALNAEQLRQNPGDSELEAVVASYELAWRMQAQRPGRARPVAARRKATQALYGIGDARDRQLRPAVPAGPAALRGGRPVHPGDLRRQHAPTRPGTSTRTCPSTATTPAPSTGRSPACSTDLKQRGLLDDTLVWWGSEFGRTPYAEKNGTGRDHNPGGFTVWLAGAGVKPGFAFGATDEFGHQAVQDKVHMHDLHATILHLLGLDHEKLTYRYSGRNFRLTDVEGRVVKEILT